MSGVNYGNIFMSIFKNKTINLTIIHQFNMDRNLWLGYSIKIIKWWFGEKRSYV